MSEANAVLSQITYTPGSKFRLIEYTVGEHLLRARFIQRNSYPPFQDVEIQVNVPLPAITFASMNAFDFLMWFRRSVTYFSAMHEADEWLEVNGIKVFDPHGDGNGEKRRWLQSQAVDEGLRERSRNVHTGLSRDAERKLRQPYPSPILDAFDSRVF